MCMKNVNALGVIILVLTALIGQCQSGKRKLKQAKSVSYQTGASDSKEDKGPNIKDLAAKIFLNSKDSEKSWNDEKIIRDGQRSEDMARKDFANRHYLILRNGTESSKEYKIISSYPDKNMNKNVAPNLKNLVKIKILNPKDNIESSQEVKKITGNLKSNSNEDVVRIHEVTAAITHMNLADGKEIRRKDEIVRGNPKIKFNERVPSNHKDLAERTDLNLEATKESITEDDVVRGDIESKFNERVPSTHGGWAAKTRLNLENTQKPIREDKIEKADTKIKLNVPVAPKQTFLATRTNLNSDDAIELRGKDEIVKSNGEKSENPGVDEKVLTIHLTNEKSNQNKDNKPVLKQLTPPPVIMRAQAEKVSNSKNAVSRKKVKALRWAFRKGSACVRLVERKCLQAMKATLKQICKLGAKKCKKDFRNDFKENVNTACYMQFNNTLPIRLGNEGSMETGAQFRDSTRSLSTTCLRALSDTTTEETQGVKSEIVDGETKNVNILRQVRDKYEKACDKESYLKCRAAGQYVSDTTCMKYNCTRAKTRAIKNTYKSFCQSYYGYEQSDSSVSSSSSDDVSSESVSSSSSE